MNASRASAKTAGRERRCVTSGEVKPEAALLRVALSPENAVTPDVAARLPGRGAWVTAARESVETAVRKNLFNRAFERAVCAPPDLADRFEALLSQRLLERLGLARRAGRLAIGYDAVRLALSGGADPAFRLEASDGARDGRRKLDALARAVECAAPVIGCFGAEALGAAAGRPGVVHAALLPGPEAEGVAVLAGKLAGFRDIDPFAAERGARGAANG